MGRAERRRQERDKGKAQKVYTLTQAQIDEIKKQAVNEATGIAFTLMLAIPVTVLHDKYWVKTASKRLPEFVDQCLGLWDAYNADYVTLEDLSKTLWDEGGIKLESSVNYKGGKRRG